MLEWKGEQVKKDMEKAEARAIRWVMQQATQEAKRNHRGWRNRTGRAEQSIQVFNVDQQKGETVGRWGSDLFYVGFLEVFNGSFMRRAADIWYAKLDEQIAIEFDRIAEKVKA